MIDVTVKRVAGLEEAIYGMRNPTRSWNKIDSYTDEDGNFVVGHDDMELMSKLYSRGPSHGKFMRMIVVWLDIEAPLYWWKDFDVYKIGVTSNSTSSWYDITHMDVDVDWFSTEFLSRKEVLALKSGVMPAVKAIKEDPRMNCREKELKIAQLLPQSFNQMRTICLNYEVLAHMARERANHVTSEWRSFVRIILEKCPYLKDITGLQVERYV